VALLGESLVEEWLNREGFFTIRGVKHGVDEMDLLAIKPQSAPAATECVGLIHRNPLMMIPSRARNSRPFLIFLLRIGSTIDEEWRC